jgi:hypothetical protein
MREGATESKKGIPTVDFFLEGALVSHSERSDISPHSALNTRECDSIPPKTL